MSEQMLLKPKEAWKALAISERTLRDLTRKGDIRSIRIGKALRYDVADLRAFIERKKVRASACALA